MSTEPEGLVALIAAQMDAAMAKLEVRLIDRFASKKEHEAAMRDVNVRIDDHEDRIKGLEENQAGSSAVAGWVWKAVGLAVGVIGAVATLVWLAHG